MRRAAATCVLLALPLLLLAQVSRDDFARGADIRTEGGSIFRVLVPDDVYETVTRPDLGDLRVLNASGDAVPHTLRKAPQPTAIDSAWSVVPSFPMSDLQRGGSAKTQVKIGTTGAVLEVTSGSARQATTAYLVDVSAIRSSLNRLALSWNASPGVTFLSRVRVDGSNDLNSWRTLVMSAALAQLQRDTFTLTQSEIELPPSSEPTRYLRISWPGELSSVTLTSVRVRPRAAATEAPIRWRTLTADHLESPGEALFDARALLPVEYLDLDFAAADALDVAVSSRPAAASPWQWRHAGLFYSLQEANGAVRSSPAQIQPATDRYWRLTRNGSSGWAAGRVPRLKLGWHAHELVFVASGAPPYTLVYGSARIANGDAPVDALLTSLDEAERARQVRDATLGPPHDLAGAAALAPVPERRRIVLWSVLALAVAVLAWIAIRTFRDTNPSPNAPR